MCALGFVLFVLFLPLPLSLCLCFSCVWDKVSLSSLDWSGTGYAGKTGLNSQRSPFSASRVLGLKVWIIMPTPAQYIYLSYRSHCCGIDIWQQPLKEGRIYSAGESIQSQGRGDVPAGAWGSCCIMSTVGSRQQEVRPRYKAQNSLIDLLNKL